MGFTILTILTIIARDNLSIQSRDGGSRARTDIHPCPTLRRTAKRQLIIVFAGARTALICHEVNEPLGEKKESSPFNWFFGLNIL